MSNQLSTIENVLINGDLTNLSPIQRVEHYKNVCEMSGLNPVTQPFAYIKLNGKLTLYALKACTDQLRAIHDISIEIKSREKVGDVYVVTASGTKKDGRRDESTGAVSIKGLAGDALANAYMKAETKAKRRVTLSMSGLGLLDENEVENIPNSIKVDTTTGEIIEGEVLSKETASQTSSNEIKELEAAVLVLKDYISNGDRLGVVELMRSYERPFIKKILNLLTPEHHAFVVETMQSAPKQKESEPEKTNYARA